MLTGVPKSPTSERLLSITKCGEYGDFDISYYLQRLPGVVYQVRSEGELTDELLQESAASFAQ